MDANVLYGKALGWQWVESGQERDGRRRPGVENLADTSPALICLQRCGKFSLVHDTVEKKWRHLDFWQQRTELIARVLRTHCHEHGILQAEVLWARTGSGFTLMMEAMILLLGKQMSVSARLVT